MGDEEEGSAFLTYLLAQKSLTLEEANAHALDLLMGAVETVRFLSQQNKKPQDKRGAGHLFGIASDQTFYNSVKGYPHPN